MTSMKNPEYEFLGIKIPAFSLPSLHTDKFNFRTVAGRPILVLRLFGDTPEQIGNLVKEALAERCFSLHYCLLFVVIDHKNLMPPTYQHQTGSNIYWLFDEKNITAQVFKGAPVNTSYWTLLDRHLRTIRIAEYQKGPSLQEAKSLVESCHANSKASKVLGRAPVLIIDNVFEKSFCEQLIHYYQTEGGQPSGVMRQVGEVTKGFLDDSFKKRKDCNLQNGEMIDIVKAKIGFRLRPLIYQAFHFDASRIERHLVACYDHIDGGFFSPHVDNSTTATKHRKFAVTINLNAEDYEGGDLYFPEYGDDVYRAPTGGAVVFSGSLLHGVTRVTKGTRYAYLPFLFSEQEKPIREATRGLIVPHQAG